MILRKTRAELEARRAQLAERNAQLRANVQNIRSDRRAIEHLIRRELGYARSDELIYKFTGDPASAP